MENYPIDFVITWVDGSDPVWQAEKAKYKGTVGDARNSRYRDWDTLKYLFRGIESYASWVNRIFLVTCGHLPKWLNTSHSKLIHIKHEDYIPKEFLPTFSCRPIELNLHRIPGLSEHFVYFNDDMLLTNTVQKEDFFLKGLPCDTAVLRPAIVRISKSGNKVTNEEMYLTPVIDMALINKYFNKHEVIRKNFWKWYSPKYGKEVLKTLSLAVWDFFPGIREYHCCYSYLKKTFVDLWKLEEDAFNVSCSHKFRVNTDYNQWVMSYWQIVTGNFSPRNPKFGTAFALNDDDSNNQKIYKTIRNSAFKTICINDNVSDDNYELIKRQFVQHMESKFPQKSSFEL